MAGPALTVLREGHSLPIMWNKGKCAFLQARRYRFCLFSFHTYLLVELFSEHAKTWSIIFFLHMMYSLVQWIEGNMTRPTARRYLNS